jgi:hypothetical protein
MEVSIYKIINKDVNVNDNHIYIGKSKNLKNRWIKHKIDCNNDKSKNYQRKIYRIIRENGGLSNYIIEEIERCDKNCSSERERYWYEQYKPTLNTYYPNRSNQESKKHWRDNHRHHLNRIYICECGGKFTHTNKSHHIKTLKHKNCCLISQQQ